MGTKINLYKQSGTDDGTSVNFNVPRSLTYGLNARANDDGGVSESDNCTYNTLNDLVPILNSASLVVTPSSYKEGKLYSVIPNTGAGDFTFTRATTATRVNSDGLVELVPYNLLSYSEQFENAAWQKISATVTPNTTIAPNGTLTADTIADTVGTYARLQQTISVEALTYTMSIYIKKTSATPTSYSGFEVLGKGTYLIFNSTTGSFSESGGPNYTTSVTSVDASWWRLSITTTVASGSRVCSIFPAISTDGTTINPTATGSIVAWGAQLVEGTSALPYQKTETRLNIPRLDYSLGGCPNILLEPQRTNLVPNGLAYQPTTGVAYNTAVSGSPMAGVNCARITKNEAAGTIRYPQQQCSSSVLAGSTGYVLSAFFKYDGVDFATTMEFNNSGNFGGVSWIQAINIASTGITLGASTSCTSTIENWGSGWYRVNVRITTGAAPTSTFITYLMRLPSTLSTGQGFLHALPQLELGAFATSYIPTTTASVTRNSDIITRDNVFTNGLISASGGTWFIELRNNVTVFADNAPSGFWLGTSAITPTNNGTLYFRQGGGSQRTNVWKFESGTATQLYTTTTDTTKLAIKWNGTTADIFANGTKVVNATAFTQTNMQFLTSANLGRTFNINQMALFPTPLTDDQLEALTGEGFNTYAEMASYYNYTLQ